MLPWWRVTWQDIIELYISRSNLSFALCVASALLRIKRSDVILPPARIVVWIREMFLTLQGNMTMKQLMWRPSRFNNFTHCDYDFRSTVFKVIMHNSSLSTHCEIVPRWMPQNLTKGKSTLDHVMAWCHQARSRYLSQCWPRSVLPYDVTRSQWVNHVYPLCHDIVMLSTLWALCEGKPLVPRCRWPSPRASITELWSFLCSSALSMSMLLNSEIASDLKCHGAHVTSL